ncbi:MAG: thioesterase family protein [Bacteroidetes bacterium]|nr:thioesterase family protein [Bacteroidota bacterium]
MSETLKQGIRGEMEILVTSKLTAAHIGSGLVEVYATPQMIALMENTAQQSVSACIEDGWTTVGTEVNIRHLKATPIGMKVRCESELVSYNGRSLTFSVKAWDETGLIGEGTHNRFIVNTKKFMAKLNGQ